MQPLVKLWRESNPHIVQYWWNVDNAVKKTIKTHEPTQVGCVSFHARNGMLFIQLPSGRQLAYVKPRIEGNHEAKKTCPDPMVCVEQTLDFSKWVEHGFGTGDCVIVADNLLHIIDFKFGVGVLVSASGDDNTGNSQMKCYALGALDAFGDLYSIKRIKLSIYQPRRENVDTFELTREQLLDWAENTLAPIAKLAYEGEGEFCAGSHCQFCKVKATCRKRAEYSMSLAAYEFAEPPLLDIDEIAEIIPQIDSLVAWADDIKKYAIEQALSGVKYPGLKLVEGRSNRKYTNEAEVARVVSEAGFDPYEQKLLGITAMTKLLGKTSTQLREYRFLQRASTALFNTLQYFLPSESSGWRSSIKASKPAPRISFSQSKTTGARATASVRIAAMKLFPSGFTSSIAQGITAGL